MKQKIRNLIPIHSGEFTKFIVTALMMLFVLYVYSIQRGAKDTLIIGQLGAEMISAIKLYGVLPCAILFMLVYSKLAHSFSRMTVFHILNLGFMAFFLLFTYVLYPNADMLHFSFLSESSLGEVHALSYVIKMLENWSFSLYYVSAELWGSGMLSLMFWQVANQVTSINESKRFYPLFGLIAQFGLIASGSYTKYVNSPKFEELGWHVSLQYINISVAAACILLSLCFYILSTKISTPEVINGASTRAKKKKPKMGFMASMKYVFSSKYIGLIATLIICYGISINLVEGVWKNQLGIAFSNKTELNHFLGDLQTLTGWGTMVAMVFGAYLLRLLSWRTAALLTPVMILVTGALFFSAVVFEDLMMAGFIGEYLNAISMTVLMLAVYSGLAQNVLSKGTKYAFFDPTKEMSYIPLDEELKSKGKAAADVIGGRLGKSGGAVIQQVFLSIIAGSTLLTIAPYLFGIFVIAVLAWLYAANALSKKFEIAKAAHEAETQES